MYTASERRWLIVPEPSWRSSALRFPVTMNIEPIAGRFESFGWHAVEIDGNDIEAVIEAFDNLPAPASTKPICVVARTKKGAGVSFMENEPQAWHLGSLKGDELTLAVREIEARIQ